MLCNVCAYYSFSCIFWCSYWISLCFNDQCIYRYYLPILPITHCCSSGERQKRTSSTSRFWTNLRIISNSWTSQCSQYACLNYVQCPCNVSMWQCHSNPFLINNNNNNNNRLYLKDSCKQYLALTYATTKYTVSQKRANFETMQLKIVMSDFDDIRLKCLKDSRIEFVCFSFHVGFLFYQLFDFSNSSSMPSSSLWH